MLLCSLNWSVPTTRSWFVLSKKTFYESHLISHSGNIVRLLTWIEAAVLCDSLKQTWARHFFAHKVVMVDSQMLHSNLGPMVFWKWRVAKLTKIDFALGYLLAPPPQRLLERLLTWFHFHLVFLSVGDRACERMREVPLQMKCRALHSAQQF
jgi:hypothetical protein